MKFSRAKSIAAAIVVTAGMIGAEAALFASSAHADPYRHRRHVYDRPLPRHVEAPRHFPREHHREHRRDRTGDAVAATVLGLGALIIGTAIADAARRKNEGRYERDED